MKVFPYSPANEFSKPRSYKSLNSSEIVQIVQTKLTVQPNKNCYYVYFNQKTSMKDMVDLGKWMESRDDIEAIIPTDECVYIEATTEAIQDLKNEFEYISNISLDDLNLKNKNEF